MNPSSSYRIPLPIAWILPVFSLCLMGWTIFQQTVPLEIRQHCHFSRSATQVDSPDPESARSPWSVADGTAQRGQGPFFRSATYQALTMNTTDDLGHSSPGCINSWGAVDADPAGQFIRQTTKSSLLRVLVGNIPRPGQTCAKTHARSGSGRSLVSLAWQDPSGPATSRDDRGARLVNVFEMTGKPSQPKKGNWE